MAIVMSVVSWFARLLYPRVGGDIGRFMVCTLAVPARWQRQAGFLMTQALNRHPACRCHHAANCVIGVRLNRKMHFHCRLSL